MKKRTKIVFTVLVLCIVLGQLYIYRYELSDNFFRFFFAEEVSLILNTVEVILSGDEKAISSIATNDANILSEQIYPVLKSIGGVVSYENIVIKSLYRGEEKGVNNFYVNGFFTEPAAVFRLRFIYEDQRGWLMKTFTVDDHYFLRIGKKGKEKGATH